MRFSFSIVLALDRLDGPFPSCDGCCFGLRQLPPADSDSLQQLKQLRQQLVTACPAWPRPLFKLASLSQAWARVLHPLPGQLVHRMPVRVKPSLLLAWILLSAVVLYYLSRRSFASPSPATSTMASSPASFVRVDFEVFGKVQGKAPSDTFPRSLSSRLVLSI